MKIGRELYHDINQIDFTSVMSDARQYPEVHELYHAVYNTISDLVQLQIIK